MLKKIIGGLFIMSMMSGASGAANNEETSWEKQPGTYAKFQTTLGHFVVRLFPDKAPTTVENFVGLAEGTKEYTDIKTNTKTTGRYYDGIIFHRVIPNFMIQTGDPLGLGTGGPGYDFEDEETGLTFDKPGILAMANRGPNTNGSQFFITVAATPWLNGRHTIFGEVVEKYEVVETISNVKRDDRDMPIEPIAMDKVEIIRVK